MTLVQPSNTIRFTILLVTLFFSVRIYTLKIWSDAEVWAHKVLQICLLQMKVVLMFWKLNFLPPILNEDIFNLEGDNNDVAVKMNRAMFCSIKLVTTLTPLLENRFAMLFEWHKLCLCNIGKKHNYRKLNVPSTKKTFLTWQ